MVRDQLAVELAAREGARAAAVSSSPAASAAGAADAATGLGPLHTTTTTDASTVTVTVSHTSSPAVPLIGLLLPDVELSATVTMAREPPP